MNRITAPITPSSQSTACRWTTSNYSTNLDRSWPRSTSPKSPDHRLHICTIRASKCISQLASLKHSSTSLSSPNLVLQVHLRTHLISASKCKSEIAESQFPTASPHSFNHGLQRAVMAWQAKDECGIVWAGYWLWGITQWVLIYQGLAWVCGEPLTLHGSMKAHQQCVGPRTENDRVCISDNEMMSIYPGLSQIYTPHHSVHHCYPCTLVWPQAASHCQTEWWWWWWWWWWWETDFPTTITPKCIAKFS